MDKSKIRGVLLGAAIGDSLGMCVEELTKDEVSNFYGERLETVLKPHPKSPACFQEAGETSSEFELIKIITQSLVEKRYLDVKDIISKYIKFKNEEHRHKYIDYHFLEAVKLLEEGIEPRNISSHIEGSLPAIPVGVFHYKNPVLAVEGSKTVVMLTYKNRYVIDVASALGFIMIQLITENYELEEEYDSFIEIIKDFVVLKDTKEYLEQVKRLLKDDISVDEAIYILGNGSFALEAFSLALFIFLKTPRNSQQAILNAVNSYGDIGGDTDAIGLIVGSFVGAYNGEESLPNHWKLRLKEYEEIVHLADKFYSLIQKF